jgi:hypothetical protein
MYYLARPSATGIIRFTLETVKAALALGYVERKDVLWLHPRHCCLGRWKVDKRVSRYLFVTFYDEVLRPSLKSAR